ncbi:MAG: type II toxin-antitoxin system VapC family toxin [Chloroflexi bacterium]|nr:type II toxin-antitoxin system VapC family toxin [Chloroflexota bacterium]
MTTHALPLLLDSSVLVKWQYRLEQDAAIALELRARHLRGELELQLADVSFYEFANALFYLRLYTTEEIIQSVHTVLAMELRVYQFDLFALRAALELCAHKGIAIYDAYLVALAQRENLVLVTADEKLLRKLGRNAPAVSLREFKRLTDSTDE